MRNGTTAASSPDSAAPAALDIDAAIARSVGADVTAAVREYDAALARNDVAELNNWFADSPTTLRADSTGVLVGREAIDRFRRSRAGAVARQVVRLHVVALNREAAIAVEETVRADGTRGVQTQAWTRRPEGWRIAAAHVSLAPSSATPSTDVLAAPCSTDPTLWRMRGDPLVRGAAIGPLKGVKIAVKDIFAVAGHRIGLGNPSWLAESATEPKSAPAVQQLLDAGADISGIVQTDEFAFSLGGTNLHYGTPPNPAAPGRVPGGSSSGPASAVALGLVEVGLGTDTAGSIRVPASYCGLFGSRPSHGFLPTTSLVELASSFDTVGWLTRDASTLELVAAVLLPETDVPPPSKMLLAEDLFLLADPDVRQVLRSTAYEVSERLGFELEVIPKVCDGQLDAWVDAFRTVQAVEAWRTHGPWLSAHPGAVEPEIAERFTHGAQITTQRRVQAENLLLDATRLLRDRIPAGTVLVQPAASTPAPLANSSDADKASMRAGTLRLTSLASVAGLPALALPGAQVDGLPVGLCLVGSRGSDLPLARLADTASPTRIEYDHDDPSATWSRCT